MNSNDQLGQHTTGSATFDWSDPDIVCVYEQHGSRSEARAPFSAGLSTFSAGFWIDRQGRYSSTESAEWVAPERIVVIYIEQGESHAGSPNDPRQCQHPWFG